jgi:hypothetical protein
MVSQEQLHNDLAEFADLLAKLNRAMRIEEFSETKKQEVYNEIFEVDVKMLELA